MINSKKMKNITVIDYDYLRESELIHQSMVESNVVATKLYDNQIKLVKLCNQSCALIEDILEYTILVINNGNYNVENFYLSDPLSHYVSFINNSLKVDGKLVPGNINDGILIDSLDINEVKRITFKVKVTSLPPCMKIKNQALVTFSNNISGDQIKSNWVIVNVENPKIHICLRASKKCVTCCSCVNYQIKLVNTGTLVAEKVRVCIKAGNGLNINWKSIYVNGANFGFRIIENGIELFDVKINEKYIIEYVATVSDCCDLKMVVWANALFKNECTSCGDSFCICSNTEEWILRVVKQQCIEKTFMISIPLFNQLNRIENLFIQPHIEENEVTAVKDVTEYSEILTKIRFHCTYLDNNEEKTIYRYHGIHTKIPDKIAHSMLDFNSEVISIENYYDWCHREFLIIGKIKICVLYY